MKGCRTIAEFGIKKMDGDEAEISDRSGDSMKVFYDKRNRKVVMR
jgi:hypothetical protein